MLKSIPKTIALTLLAAAISALPASLLAQSTNKAPVKKAAPEKSEPAVRKSRSIPFSGNLAAIDKAAKTIKVGKRTIQITSETKIQKADQPATLAEGAVGEYVTGSYTKADDGKLLAHSVYFGGKTKAKVEPKK